MDQVSTQEVVVRRSPKYLTFMIVGIMVGILIALILTVAFPNNSNFTLLQIFGFLLLISGAIGGTLGLVFALILDRLFSKRTVIATAEHEHVTES